jgi:REP element-mobilizing transposase RayT
MQNPPFLIGRHERPIVEAAISELCEHRTWELMAMNVRTNHVHVVLAAGAAPERVMGDLKAYSTRAMRRAGLVAAQQKVWARHGSTRWVWDSDQVDRCVTYTLDAQGDDLPGAAWAVRTRTLRAQDNGAPGPNGTGY